jgi:predicted TPR repeat methyltransferase
MSRQAEVLERVLLEADALLREGRFPEGEDRARAVLAQQPRNPGGHYLMGLSALMQERHVDALAHVERALKLDRVNAQYHFMAALCLAPLQRLDEAMASYRRALQFRPEFLEARANLGYLLECSGRGEEAAECYRKVLAHNPDEWFTLNRLGYCERMLGRAESALVPLARAVALEPRSAPTHNELALALLQLGRTAEAIASLRNAVEADPKFAEGWANLAKLLYVEHLEAVRRTERGEGAPPEVGPVIECFDRLLGFDPANVEFKYLRDCLAGERLERPPDRYIEAFFDRFAGQFEQRLLGELAYSAPAVAARMLDGLLHGRTGLRVADLGCGTGLFGDYLRAKAGYLAGVDLSGAMLERARARGRYDELVREEIGDYLARIEPGSLDLAVALDVFIYVGNLGRVLDAARGAMAPDGVLVFSIEDLRERRRDREASAESNGREAPAESYTLLPAGRYAHARAYVEAAAIRAGLTPVAVEPFDIRVEAGQPVPALLFALRKA